LSLAKPLDPHRLEFSGEPRIVEEGVETNLGWNLGVFSASQNGVLAFAPAAPNSGNQIMWMSAAGKRLEAVGDVGHYQSLRFSPDGQQLAVEHERPSHHLWVYDLKRESRSQFTFGSSADTVPVWSPDGKQILFASDHNGHADLYRKTVGGSEGERLLLESVNNKFPLDWSPDGKALLYAETDQSYKSSLWVLPMSGSEKPHLLLPDEFYAEDGFFSPDGHWIAYTSREQGTNQVFVVPYPGPGAKKQISSTGGSSPVWRKDGRAVFFIDDSNNIQQTEMDIRNSSLMLGSTRTLFHGNMEILPDQGRTYDVASDGRFIGNIRKQENQIQIVVVSNWSTALRK
jgi:eukaryotic-like serine/threonine-protein kinase